MILSTELKTLENISEGEILVKVDAIGLYPSIPHKTELIVLRETLYDKENKHIPTDNLLKL